MRTAWRPAPPALQDDWALFLDVDGSLLEFADTPDGVQVPEGLRARLLLLGEQRGGALALISGRNIAMLDTLFSPSRFAAAGLHGVEQRPAGREATTATPPAVLEDIRVEATRLAACYAGTLIEDKGAAIALHWRGGLDGQHALLAFAEQALARLPGYCLQLGNHVAELRPGHADKGSAIAAFLDTPPFAGRMPAFAGDDLTDEAGFREVNSRGGISILIGDRVDSVARYQLRDPDALHAWLGVPP